MKKVLSLSLLVVSTLGIRPAHALEAVVQSDVGSGSAVAGSLGAVHARTDALQANQAAANSLVNQMSQQLQQQQTVISNTVQRLDSIENCIRQGLLWNGAQCVDLTQTQNFQNNVSHMINNQVSTQLGNTGVSLENCTWVGAVRGVRENICPNGMATVGIGYEPATWSFDTDTHYNPEVDRVLCCNLRLH